MMISSQWKSQCCDETEATEGVLGEGKVHVCTSWEFAGDKLTYVVQLFNGTDVVSQTHTYWMQLGVY